MSERIDILTPTGRLVQGDCFVPQTTDAEGRPLVIKNGPNAGQPRVDYFMAVAVPKTDPGITELVAKIMGAAAAAFPAMFDASGTCNRPGFAFKMIDGDSTTPNTKGIRPCDRVGFPGHMVLYFSSGFAPKCYTAGGAELIIDPAMIRRGYYIRIYGSVVGNGSQQQPGVFLNHNMVELVGYGEEINTGPDGNAVFGGTPAGALPAGASATPVAGAPLAAPVAQVAVTPAPDFLAAAPAAPAIGSMQVAPSPAGAPAPAPAPPMFVTADGGHWTAEQLTGHGYTAEQIAALPTA